MSPFLKNFSKHHSIDKSGTVQTCKLSYVDDYQKTQNYKQIDEKQLSVKSGQARSMDRGVRFLLLILYVK